MIHSKMILGYLYVLRLQAYITTGNVYDTIRQINIWFDITPRLLLTNVPGPLLKSICFRYKGSQPKTRDIFKVVNESDMETPALVGFFLVQNEK